MYFLFARDAVRTIKQIDFHLLVNVIEGVTDFWHDIDSRAAQRCANALVALSVVGFGVDVVRELWQQTEIKKRLNSSDNNNNKN